jgi:hypothetical protein
MVYPAPNGSVGDAQKGGAIGVLMCYTLVMPSETFTRAIVKAQQLPDADQERIGRELSEHVDDLCTLRADIEQGLRSLDAGLGKELEIEDVIARGRAE